MKKIFVPVIGFLAVLCISSCSEDFDVAAPYKNITVGYSLLNMGDTAHYIRIQKAFLDESKDAYSMAAEDDSSFYSNIEVHMKEVNVVTGVVQDDILPRVDLRKEGYIKNGGTFFTDISYAYKYKHTLNPYYRYRVVIINKTTNAIDSAETCVINNDSTKFKVNEFKLQQFRVAFAQPSGKFKMKLFVPDSTAIVQGIIRFKWWEKNMLTNDEKLDSADWSFYPIGDPLGNDPFNNNTLTTANSDFYTNLYNLMKPAANSNIARYMDSCDIFIWAGTGVLSAYISTSTAQAGITGDQIKPSYTNFHSTSGNSSVQGLFTSRAMISDLNRAIDNNSIDSLGVNSITRALNIKGRSTLINH